MHVYIYASTRLLRQRTKKKTLKEKKKNVFPHPRLQRPFLYVETLNIMQRRPLKRYDDSCCCTKHRSSATTLKVHGLLPSIHITRATCCRLYINTYTYTYSSSSSLVFLSAKRILMAVLDKTWVACVLGASVPDLSTEPPHAGPHRVDSGRVADPPRVGGQRTRTRKKKREDISPVGG